MKYIVHPEIDLEHNIEAVIGSDESPCSNEMAISTALDVCFTKQPISFSTYRTDIMIGDIIEVRGIKYKVTSIAYKITKNGSIQSINGETYGY
jgi:hypothetical protein